MICFIEELESFPYVDLPQRGYFGFALAWIEVAVHT